MKLFIVISFFLHLSFSQSHYITSFQTEDCLVNDDTPDCFNKKFVMRIADGGNKKYLRKDKYHITQMNDPSGYPDEITITFVRKRPVIFYPLVFYHAVAYRPYNLTIRQMGCEDSSMATNPTCGWQYQGATQIQHSQGFCCGVITAHCMRLGDVTSMGYEIDSYQTYFGYQIEIAYKNNGIDQTYTFNIDPSNALFTTDIATDWPETWGFSMEMIGDFSRFTAAPQLDSHIYYIPDSPSTHNLVINANDNAMLVDRTEVTKSGEECDKVGVSFYRFRQQAAYCDYPESCLKNQLYDKHQQDLDNLTDAQYLVKYLDDFKGDVEYVDNVMQKHLEYTLDSFGALFTFGISVHDSQTDCYNPSECGVGICHWNGTRGSSGVDCSETEVYCSQECYEGICVGTDLCECNDATADPLDFCSSSMSLKISGSILLLIVLILF